MAVCSTNRIMSGVERTRIGSCRRCAGVRSSVTVTDLECLSPTVSGPFALSLMSEDYGRVVAQCQAHGAVPYAARCRRSMATPDAPPVAPPDAPPVAPPVAPPDAPPVAPPDAPPVAPPDAPPVAPPVASLATVLL